LSPEFFAPHRKAWNNGGMKRLKLVFAIVLLLLALPFWRFTDVVAILSPFKWPLPFALTVWFSIFITIPLRLLIPKIKTYIQLLVILCFASLTWWSGSLSKMATIDPDFNHCGTMTYTGFFYPVHGLLSDAHRDDLEARNQLCWIRKMISRVPSKFDSEHEAMTYTKLIQDKLFKPEIKYRASLPLIAFLYLAINTSAGQHVGVKQVYDSLHFWIDHYTDEISRREYSVWNWPHSNYIIFEYGLVENNWQNLIDSIVLEKN
jgi:hypothetical protein